MYNCPNHNWFLTISKRFVIGGATQIASKCERNTEKKNWFTGKRDIWSSIRWEYVNVNDKLSINKRSEGQSLHRIQSCFWVILCFNWKILIKLCILLDNLWAHAHCTQKLTHSLHLSVALWAQPIATELPIAKKKLPNNAEKGIVEIFHKLVPIIVWDDISQATATRNMKRKKRNALA